MLQKRSGEKYSQKLSENNVIPKPFGLQDLKETYKNQSVHRVKETDKNTISVMVKMKEGDELQPAFIQSFSKHCLTHTQILKDHLKDNNEVTYESFFKFLKDFNKDTAQKNTYYNIRLPRTRSTENVLTGKSIRKTSGDGIDKVNFKFSFQAHNNSIILLLDLSPYMLIYDSASKSFPLKNMERIIINLIDSLEWHFREREARRFTSKYRISVFGFSTVFDRIIEFLKNQEIMFKKNGQGISNKEKIKDFINSCISSSKLPYMHQQKTYTISSFIQRVINYEYGNVLGIQTLVTISTFDDFDIKSRLFFSSNWFTFAFICTGLLNFASYSIEDEQIMSRFPTNPYFKTKYVYKADFIENWEKVHKLQKNILKQSQFVTPAPQKHRLIIYREGGKYKYTIFDDVLKFTIDTQSFKLRRHQNASHLFENKNQNKYIEPLNFKNFKIPEQNIIEIIKTKYMQGWAYDTHSGFFSDTLMYFKLKLGKEKLLIYKAKKSGRYYQISINEEVKAQNNMVHQKQQQTSDLINSIMIIDLIQTSNFDLIKNKDPKKQQNYYNLDTRGYLGRNILNYIFDNHVSWSRFLKIDKVYILFKNTFNLALFNEFVSEVSDYLGILISNMCFLNRKNKQTRFDARANTENSGSKIVFIKISCQLNIIELKFGFLKYGFHEMKAYMESFVAKINDIKNNSQLKIELAPEDLYKFCHYNFETSDQKIFHKKWKITFPQRQVFYTTFKLFNISILKRYSYNLLKSKTPLFYYYRLLDIQAINKNFTKPIFLTVFYDDHDKSVSFVLSAFPDLQIIQKSRSVPELINQKKDNTFIEYFKVIEEQLKEAQSKTINLLKNYGEIYERVIKNRNDKSDSKWTSRLKKNITVIQTNINIDEIPEPSKFLMESEVTSIKGDLTVASSKYPEKYYAFYNIKNKIVIYLFKNGKVINYRCLNFAIMMPNLGNPVELDAKEVSSNLEEIIKQEEELEKIVLDIQRQEREEKFKLFYEAVRSGQNIEVMANYEENLKNFHKPSLQFRQIVEIVRKKKYSHISYRFTAVLDQLYDQFISSINCFFKQGETHCYFSEKKSAQLDENLSKNIRESFSNLILKVQYGQKMITKKNWFSRENFINLFLIDEEPGFITLKFYGYTIQYDKIDYLTHHLKGLIQQCVVYLKLLVVTQDNGVPALKKYLKSQSYVQLINFNLKVIEQLSNSYDDIIRYIEVLILPSFLDFHLVGENEDLNKSRLSLSSVRQIDKNPELIANQQEISPKSGQKVNSSFKICLKYWIHLEIIRQKNLINVEYLNFHHIIMSPHLKTGNFGEIIHSEIDTFMSEIYKTTKIYNIFKQIQKTLKFPSETFIPIYLNQQNYEQLKKKKKKIVKTTNKWNRYKNLPTPIEKEEIALIEPETFYLKLIHEEVFPFYGTFSGISALHKLAKNQIMNSFFIRNLENVYIFFNHEVKDYYFFCLEEPDDEQQPPTPDRKQKKNEKKTEKNLLRIEIYAINECFLKGEKYKTHLTLIKKALEQVVLDQIATQIIIQNQFLRELHFSHSQKNSLKRGEQWSFKLMIPNIAEKYNFRQYFRQHLENQFRHRIAKFVKDKKKEPESKNEKCQQLTNQGEEEQWNEPQTEQCEKKGCIPSIWIFNTINQPKQALKYGRCLYLLEIAICSSYSTVENVDIWKQINNNQSKSFIYPAWTLEDAEGRSEEDSQYEQFTQFMKKWIEYEKEPMSPDPLSESGTEHPFQYMTIKFNFISYFGSPKLQKIKQTYRDLLYCTICDYWFEYYVFNTLNKNLHSVRRKKENMIKSFNNNGSDSFSPLLKKVDSSPEKFHEKNLPVEDPLSIMLYTKLIEIDNFWNVAQNQLNQLQKSEGNIKLQSQSSYEKISSCTHRYNSTNRLLIQEKFQFLNEMFKKFKSIFSVAKESFNLPLLFYAKIKDVLLIWQLQYSQYPIKEFQEKNRPGSVDWDKILQLSSIQSTKLVTSSMTSANSQNQHIRLTQLGNICQNIKNIEQYILEMHEQPEKIGIMFLDCLQDQNSMKLIKYDEKDLYKKDKNSQQEKHYFLSEIFNDEDIDLEKIKYFKQDKSFCQNQFLFKRSLYMNFVCTDHNFCFFTYNFQQNNKSYQQLTKYLQNMEKWYFEKYRLLQFITNVKNKKLQNGVYEIPPKNQRDNPEENYPPINQAELTQNFSKLIVELVVRKRPNSNRYLEMGQNIDRMYQILSKKQLNYPKNQYPGKEKSMLERMGKQYLSILKHQYGMQPISNNTNP